MLVLSGAFEARVGAAETADANGAVFVMTSAVENNQIDAYIRRADGSLQPAGVFSTGGNGSGETIS